MELQESLAAFSEREELPIFNLSLLPLRSQQTQQEIVQTIDNLNADSAIEAAFPVFKFPDAELILTDEFVAKFNPDITVAEIETFNALNNVEVARKFDWADWYVLRVKEPANMSTLQMANLYHENPITEFAMPNFIRKLQPLAVTPNDTYFSSQWHLNNTAQNPPGGTAGADIKAPKGWEVCTGSSDIVIAIIDDGVDITHPDFAGKLVTGYDCVYEDNDPTPWENDAHGTACAGIAAGATNNTIGIAGVAWGCKIMPIRVFEGAYTSEECLANGIQWAASNGADVLSNSWGGGPDSQLIHNAIINAKNNGRDGKGCVIVFASGNSSGSVEFPARYPEVIAVGATNEDDIRWSYSSYGDELDVVAPSGLTNLLGNIWTTDIVGSAGVNNRNGSILDYTDKMGGTSAACPQVAGLAGLILSKYPDCTSDEVQDIIQSTADDKGAAGWHILWVGEDKRL